MSFCDHLSLFVVCGGAQKCSRVAFLSDVTSYFYSFCLLFLHLYMPLYTIYSAPRVPANYNFAPSLAPPRP